MRGPLLRCGAGRGIVRERDAGSVGAEPSVSAATAMAVKKQIEQSRSDPSMLGL